MRLESTINEFKKVDAARADYPGEHLVVLGAGVLLLLPRSPLPLPPRSRPARRAAR